MISHLSDFVKLNLTLIVYFLNYLRNIVLAFIASNVSTVCIGKQLLQANSRQYKFERELYFQNLHPSAAVRLNSEAPVLDSLVIIINKSTCALLNMQRFAEKGLFVKSPKNSVHDVNSTY